MSEKNRSSIHRRMLAVSLDLLIMMILLSPLLDIIAYVIYGGSMPIDVINRITDGIQEEAGAEGVHKMINALSDQSFFLKYFLLQMLSFLIMSAYVIVFWLKLNGSTPGKWICACRVVNFKTGGKITLPQAVRRVIGYVLSAIPLGLGFVIAAFRKDSRGFHDKISGTTVVNFKHSFKKFEDLRHNLLRRL